jgi:hypothetical protein
MGWHDNLLAYASVSVRGADMLTILKDLGPVGAVGLLIGIVLLAIVQPRTAGGAMLIMMVPVLLAVSVWPVVKSVRNWRRS